MAVTDPIFQASDLNQRGRSILDAARAGEARVRDKDGMGLVVLPEQRLDALKSIARASANLLALELAMAAAPDRLPRVHEMGEWTWLREFDREDLLEFLDEMRRCLLVASREENASPIDDTVSRWRATAETLEDPTRRQILMSPRSDDDFVEVDRPE